MGFARIDAAEATVVFDLRDAAQPGVAYFGRRLPPGAALEDLGLLLAEGPRPSTADRTPQVSLCPTAGEGFQGTPALILADGRLLRLRLTEANQTEDGLAFTLADLDAGVTVVQRWRAWSHGFRVSTAVVNMGQTAFGLAQAAAVTLPLPAWATQRLTFAGRWAGEFHTRHLPIPDGSHELVSRGGRPGFENAGFLVLADALTGAATGPALAAHTAWSGNVRSLVERTGFGQGQLQIGERLEPGEVLIDPGARYDAPDAVLVFSEDGFGGVRAAFHALAAEVGAPLKGPRRVHFNSWEAVYFDLDLPRLTALAEEAAALGAERFVLDDGWFSGRRDDGAALGDWTPDSERFPQGLGPLIAQIEALGMDFGIWVEPEMVSPDSALYRAHPEWALQPATGEAPTQRRQLVLDLSQTAVQDHVIRVLDDLVRANRIAYLKWDHNRDLFPCPSPHQQTQGFYQVLDRLRAAHPDVEIESCASGGGRIDFGVMQRSARFWVSDNTDAAARLAIQSAASLFVPLERLGSHVGASPNPSTGRRLSMLFRARIALFAHMGIEADPTKLSPNEKDILRDHIALYKEHRDLIHGGRFLSFTGEDPGVTVWACVAADGREALALAARVDAAAGLISLPVRLRGLDPLARYRVRLIRPWPEPARRLLGESGLWRGEPVLDGALLQEVGLRLPLIHPETAWLVHLKAVEGAKA